jgi:hypothetical protein
MLKYIHSCLFFVYIVDKDFEDNKRVIINRILRKNIQHNGQKKKYKRTNNDLQDIHIKLKIANPSSMSVLLITNLL